MRNAEGMNTIPAPLPGFENVKRYWDMALQMPAARILHKKDIDKRPVGREVELF